MAGKGTNKGAAWARNLTVLAIMTLVALCGYAALGPRTEEAPPVAEMPPPVEAPPVTLPVVVPPPVESEPLEPVVEPIVAVAAPPPVVVPPAPIPEPVAAPVEVPVEVPVVATAPVVAALPPVAAAGPLPAPAPDFLPIGPATDQFADPSPDVASALAINFETGPGLPQVDDSQAIIQPCQAAASCSVDLPVTGQIGLVIVDGGWPPPAP